MAWRTYLEAFVSPRKDGRFIGTCARSSVGGRTGRCTKWVVARSMICFWSCEKETVLCRFVSKKFKNYRSEVELSNDGGNNCITGQTSANDGVGSA